MVHSFNAMITILNHDEYNSEVRTDSINGDYYRMLAPGTYTFEFSAAHHFPKTINGVQVNNLQATILNVELIPEDPVPVELISFNAVVKNTLVELTWQTATEINNRGFEVQRKMEHGEFSIIGFVEGNGTTTEIRNYTFTDENVAHGLYLYRLKQIDFDGNFTYLDNIEVEVFAPLVFSLEQNYPNPFNPSTSINYSIPANGFITLKVYDVLGNEVAILVSDEKSAGNHVVSFDAVNLSSGLYFYTLQSGSFTETKKMVLLK